MNTQPTGYESPSWWYDIRGFFILKLAYRGSLLEQMRFFSRNVGAKHLEAAIGSGTLFDMIIKWMKLSRRQLGEVTAYDYADSMLAGARRRFGKNKHVKLMSANAHELPFEDCSFETINVANAIHCFSKIDRALSEMHRVLVPGGRVATNVLTYPTGNRLQKWAANRINRWGAKKGILHTPYEPAEFKGYAVAAGFQVVEEFQTGNGLFLVLEKPKAESSKRAR